MSLPTDNDTQLVPPTSTDGGAILRRFTTYTATTIHLLSHRTRGAAEVHHTILNHNNDNNDSMNIKTTSFDDYDPYIKSDNDNSNNTAIIRSSLLAGSIAGMTNVALFHPFDVIRTKIQYHNNHSSATTSLRSTVTSTIQHGGFRALYTGLSVPLVAQGLYKATAFTVNDMARRAITDYRTRKGSYHDGYQLSLGEVFACGAMGGTVNGALFVAPVEYVRNNLIAQQALLSQEEERRRIRRPWWSPHASTTTRSMTTMTMIPKDDILRGPLDVVKRTLRSSRWGILGLWRGMAVTTTRDALGVGMYFLAFENTKRHLTEYWYRNDNNNKIQNHYGITLLSGATAGVGFWLLAMPLDTIKTLVQTGASPTAFRVVMDCCWGPRGRGDVMGRGSGGGGLWRLYRGWPLAFGRGAPSAAITLLVYDYMNKMFLKSDLF